MADTKKEALEAAKKFKFNAVKNAALDAVALHENLASYEDELEEEYLEEKAAAVHCTCPISGEVIVRECPIHGEQRATIASKKTAAPPDEEPEPAPTEQPSPEPAEVQRDEPATEAPHITAPPPAVEPPPAEIEEAPEAIETPVPEPVAETPVEEPESKDEAYDELAVRTEVEAAIGDPETIEAVMEFLKEEDLLHAHGFEIKEGMWGWHEASNFATISFGNKEYVVAPTYDAAEEFATAMVRQQLRDEPDLFTPSWLEGYIDKEALEAQLRPDVEEMIRESPDSYGWEPGKIRDEDDEEEGAQLSLPAEDEPSDEWITDKADEVLSDPIEYLREIYGDETMKRAMEIAGIDIEEAASDSVAAEGMGHFLSSYDGDTHDLPSGGVWWRTS